MLHRHDLLDSACRAQMSHGEIVDVHVRRDDLHLIGPVAGPSSAGACSTTSGRRRRFRMSSAGSRTQPAVGKRVSKEVVHALNARAHDLQRARAGRTRRW